MILTILKVKIQTAWCKHMNLKWILQTSARGKREGDGIIRGGLSLFLHQLKEKEELGWL